MIKPQSVVSVLHVGYLAEAVNPIHLINVHPVRILLSNICLDINASQTVRMGPIKMYRHLNVKDVRLAAKFVIQETTRFVLIANLDYRYLIILVDRNVLTNIKRAQTAQSVNSELML